MKLYYIILNCCNNPFYNLFSSAQQTGFVTKIMPRSKAFIQEHFPFQICARRKGEENLQEQRLRKHPFV